PGLGQRMSFEQVRKGAANLVGNLKQQRASEAILEIGGDEAADMAEVVRDRALEQVALQRGDGRRGEEVIEPQRTAVALAIALHQDVPIRPFADGTVRNL